MTSETPHFNQGDESLAFVFSVPGARERDEGRPVAGDTGENLSSALEDLHAADPDMFPSTDRYAYRITNSWPEPLAKSLGTASQPKDSRVREPGNVRRVVDELRACGVVVLCGRKAQLLSDCIRSPERTVVHMCHTGNQSLNGTYRLGIASMARSPAERRRARAELWAKELLQRIAIAQVDGTPS